MLIIPAMRRIKITLLFSIDDDGRERGQSGEQDGEDENNEGDHKEHQEGQGNDINQGGFLHAHLVDVMGTDDDEDQRPDDGRIANKGYPS